MLDYKTALYTTFRFKTLFRAVQHFLRLLPGARSEDRGRHALSLHQGIGTLFKRVWHLPDTYRWMEPLPAFHRRWILIAAALLLVVLLWPYSPPSSTPTLAPVPAPAALQSTVPMQANIVESPNMPEPVPATPAPAAWQSYHIAAGQTLAQLFRENNLPVNDVFAMAQVEGRDKPLSNLRAGQEVKLRLNAQGMIAELGIETTNGQRVQFIRQPDGAFAITP